MRRITVFSCLTTALILALLAAPAPARTPSARVAMAPVADLIDGFTKYVQAHSDSADAYYRLGRVEYLAGALKLSFIGIRDYSGEDVRNRTELDGIGVILINMFEPGKPTRQPWGEYGLFLDHTKGPLDRDTAGNPWAGGIANPDMTPETAAKQLRAAITNLRLAVLKDPKVARHHLGLACALEDAVRAKLADIPEAIGAGVGRDSGSDVEDGTLKPHRPEAHAASPEALKLEAKAEYLQAYELASPADLKATELPWAGRCSFVSYEAGRGYLRLEVGAGPTTVEAVPIPEPGAHQEPLNDAQKYQAKIREIRKAVDQIDRLEPSPNPRY